jgi:hypothetical protein
MFFVYQRLKVVVLLRLCFELRWKVNSCADVRLFVVMNDKKRRD